MLERGFDDVTKRSEIPGFRSTSFSLKSGVKKKAQEITRLYEFDAEEDPDPYYEIYDAQRMTFLESVLNKPMNNYVRW